MRFTPATIAACAFILVSCQSIPKQPPERYRGDWNGTVSVLKGAPYLCAVLMRDESERDHYEGCYSPDLGILIEPNARRGLLEHEIGHAKGWPADHPD